MAGPPNTVAYEFSEAERKALRECATESFFYYSLPLMTIFGTLTYLGLKRGVLRPHRKYGAFPKLFLACNAGYFLGKFTYVEECTNKLIHLPDSKLGDFILRRRLGIPFSPDELRVLQECNRESFYQRSVPFGAILGTGTYLAVKSGHLSSNPRFGAVPKVIGAVLMGYFIGKISYQTKCAEKLMSVPDSKIGAMLRSRRYGNQDTLTMEDQGLEKAVSSIPESEKFSDIASNQLDLDMDRPLIPGLEDYRPNFDDVRINDGNFQPPLGGSPATTYDELRRRNREEYEQKRTRAYRGVIAPEGVPSGARVEEHSPLQPQPSSPRNIYGDTFEK